MESSYYVHDCFRGTAYGYSQNTFDAYWYHASLSENNGEKFVGLHFEDVNENLELGLTLTIPDTERLITALQDVVKKAKGGESVATTN